MHKRTSGLVLKSYDFKEADQIVVVFSGDLGKIRVVARGVKKPKSSLRALVQPFCYSDFYLVPSGDMYILTQGKSLDFFPELRTNLDRTLQALYVVELLEKCVADRDPHPELLVLVLETLRFLSGKERGDFILRHFEARLAVQLGLAPVLDQCQGCGSKVKLNGFSSEAGGALCSACAAEAGARTVSPAALSALNLLMKNNTAILKRVRLPEGVEREIGCMIGDHLRAALEISLPVLGRLPNLTKGPGG
ncbi:MAG: DNA repair protein RecO [Solirubrobacterales bacterium]